MSSSIQFEYHGLTMRGIRYGSGKPIIALHGWLDNAASYAKLAPLIDDTYSIDCWELIGHGHSDHIPLFAHYHFIDTLPLFSALLTQYYRNQQCMMMGHSLGGAIASVIAALIPDQISHCIAIEGFGPLTSPLESIVEQMQSYCHSQATAKTHRPYDSIEQAATVRSRKTPICYEDALLLCERGMREHEDKFIWTHDKRLTDPSPLQLIEPQVSCILDALQTPFCFIQADHGFRPEMLKARFESLNCEKKYSQLPGRHHIHMEQPQQVADIINTFIQL